MAVIFVAGGTGYLGRQLIPRLLERLPSAQQTARRLGLVTLAQMTAALVCAVEQPANGFRVVEVPEIRNSRLDHRAGGC